MKLRVESEAAEAAGAAETGMKPSTLPMRRFQHSLHRVLICLLMSSFAACAQPQPRPELPAVTAIPPGESSPLDRATAPAEARHPGQSGFRLVIEGPEAFVTRAQSARMAIRSLDVQTYIWHADLTILLKKRIV